MLVFDGCTTPAFSLANSTASSEVKSSSRMIR